MTPSEKFNLSEKIKETNVIGKFLFTKHVRTFIKKLKEDIKITQEFSEKHLANVSNHTRAHIIDKLDWVKREIDTLAGDELK